MGNKNVKIENFNCKAVLKFSGLNVQAELEYGQSTRGLRYQFRRADKILINCNGELSTNDLKTLIAWLHEVSLAMEG